MKPVDVLKYFDVRFATISLTGDGRREHPILMALAERYNGSGNVLQLPAVVAPLGHGNKKVGRFCGFSVLQAIPTYVTKFKYGKYLFLIDIEHFSDSENVRREIEHELTGRGFAQIKINPIANQAFLIKCRHGFHEITIHTVIFGKEKNIEENLAMLVFLEFGLRVESTKPAVDQVLRQKGINLYAFIKNARQNNVKRALPALAAAFESIEKTGRRTTS